MIEGSCGSPNGIYLGHEREPDNVNSLVSV